MSIVIPFLITLHVIVCLLIVVVVLMQLPRSEGLGAAFGGAVTENIFGAQTTNVLAKFTVWLGVAFFAITLLLAVAYTHRGKDKASAIQRDMMAPAAATAPAAVATPAASAPPVAAPAAVATPIPVVPETSAAPVPAPAASATP